MMDREIRVVHIKMTLIAVAVLSLVLGGCSANGNGEQKTGGKKTAQMTVGQVDTGNETVVNSGIPESPAADGKTERPAADGKTERPVAGGKTEKPAADGKTESPVAGGKTELSGLEDNLTRRENVQRAQTDIEGTTNLCLSLPEDESLYSNPVISQDETMIQILFRDENTQSDAIAWASLEPEGGPSGYYILDVEGQRQSTAAAEDGSLVELKIRKTVENSDIHGILVSWEYNGVFYELWEDDAREQEDKVTLMAAGIAIRSMEVSRSAKE